MTYVDNSQFGTNHQFELGRAHAYLDQVIRNLKGGGQSNHTNFGDENVTLTRTAAGQRLAEIQKAISAFSMHLPKQFATGLGRQFANMLDEEAWDEDDKLPELLALSTFLNMLIKTGAQRRPGIGTNGRGSVTAFWLKDKNRLTADCLPSGDVSWVLSTAREGGEKERAAGVCSPARLSAVVAPYNPGIWFDQ